MEVAVINNHSMLFSMIFCFFQFDAPSMTLNYVLLVVVLLIFAMMAYRNRQHICATKRRIVHLRRLSSTFTMGGIFR